jgi:hypothetical protein
MLNVGMVAWLHKLVFCSVSEVYVLVAVPFFFFFSYSLLGQCFLKGVSWNLIARGFVKCLQKLGHFVCFCSYFN